MIRFIILLTKIVLTAMISLVFASCNWKSVRGSGHVTTETRNIGGDFRSIDASKALDVELIQSGERSVTVVADDNLQQHIKTRVEEGVLIITSDVDNYSIVTSKKIIVRMPVIENIHVSSAASLVSKSPVKGKEITIKASSAGEININIEVEQAVCESSSGSSISIMGKAIKLRVESASGSDIDAEDLLSNDITAKASSGSSIDVHPLVSIDAKASSGASIDYVGHPSIVHKKESSGGSVEKK